MHAVRGVQYFRHSGLTAKLLKTGEISTTDEHRFTQIREEKISHKGDKDTQGAQRDFGCEG